MLPCYGNIVNFEARFIISTEQRRQLQTAHKSITRITPQSANRPLLALEYQKTPSRYQISPHAMLAYDGLILYVFVSIFRAEKSACKLQINLQLSYGSPGYVALLHLQSKFGYLHWNNVSFQRMANRGEKLRGVLISPKHHPSGTPSPPLICPLPELAEDVTLDANIIPRYR